MPYAMGPTERPEPTGSPASPRRSSVQSPTAAAATSPHAAHRGDRTTATSAKQTTDITANIQLLGTSAPSAARQVPAYTTPMHTRYTARGVACARAKSSAYAASREGLAKRRARSREPVTASASGAIGHIAAPGNMERKVVITWR